MDSEDGELNMGCMSEEQILTFCEKMYEMGFTMHCEQYEWIPKDYTEVSIILDSEDGERRLFLFCLTDNTWILCSDYTHSFASSKVLRYA